MPTDPRTEDFTLLDLLAAEPTITRAQHATEVRRAVARVARMTGGIVTAATLRDQTPEWVDAHVRGAVVSALVKQGVLVDTGRTVKSGNRKSRNGNRKVPVYRLANIEAVTA